MDSTKPVIQTEYLTFKEASEFLRLSEQTLRNKVALGVFRRGVHFFKREGEISVRFKRSALIAWLEGSDAEQPQENSNVIPMARGYALNQKS